MSIGQNAYRSFRSTVPRRFRRSLGAAVEEFGIRTSGMRMLPSFAIVGGQRCGTNSLYEYLLAHPRIARALPIPEVHFFDLNFDRGLSWYRGHFPTGVNAALTKSKPGLITGESSPYYMFHPHAPKRMAETLPDIKLFVMLRNPVDRAYSHYAHERTRGHERLSFEEAVAREPERLEREVERMLGDPNYQSFNHQHFSYLSRGVYHEQLEILFSLFSRGNVCVVFSEQLFDDPATVHAQAVRFLGLPPSPPIEYRKHNPGRYTGMSSETRARLTEHFSGSNARLYHLLGSRPRWD